MPITSRFGSMSSQGFGQFLTKKTSARIEFITYYSAVVIKPPINIASISIGSASASRIVALTVAGVGLSSLNFSLNLGGVKPTYVAGLSDGIATTSAIKILQRTITTGTATSLNISSGASNPTLVIVSVGVYAIYEAESTVAYSNRYYGAQSQTINAIIPEKPNSVHLGIAQNVSSATVPSITITTFTTNYRATNNAHQAVGASLSSTLSQSTAITITSAPSTALYFATASWK